MNLNNQNIPINHIHNYYDKKKATLNVIYYFNPNKVKLVTPA